MISWFEQFAWREWENFTQAGTKTKGKCSRPGRWAAQMTYQASLSEIPGSKIEETEQSDRGNLDTGGQEEDVRSPLRVCRLVASYPHITFCEYTFTDSLTQWSPLTQQSSQNSQIFEKSHEIQKFSFQSSFSDGKHETRTTGHRVPSVFIFYKQLSFCVSHAASLNQCSCARLLACHPWQSVILDKDHHIPSCCREDMVMSSSLSQSFCDWLLFCLWVRADWFRARWRLAGIKRKEMKEIWTRRRDTISGKFLICFQKSQLLATVCCSFTLKYCVGNSKNK